MAEVYAQQNLIQVLCVETDRPTDQPRNRLQDGLWPNHKKQTSAQLGSYSLVGRSLDNEIIIILTMMIGMNVTKF